MSEREGITALKIIYIIDSTKYHWQYLNRMEYFDIIQNLPVQLVDCSYSTKLVIHGENSDILQSNFD